SMMRGATGDCSFPETAALSLVRKWTTLTASGPHPSWSILVAPTARHPDAEGSRDHKELVGRPAPGFRAQPLPSRLSAEELLNRLAAVDDLDRSTARGSVLGLEVDAHRPGQGGDQIHHGDGAVDDVDAVLVGCADDPAVLHTPAADDHRPTARPV